VTESPATVSPRLRGTVIHAWFEQIEWLGSSTQLAEQQLIDAVADLLIRPADRAQLQREFDAMLTRPNTRRSLSRADVMALPEFQSFAADIKAGTTTLEVHQERPFVRQRQGAIVQGTIDRLVLLRRNGVPVAADVLDFKTDRFQGDRSEWVAEKVEHYGSQLDEYREAVEACFGIPPAHISTRLLLLEADVVVSAQRSAASRLAS